MSEAEIDTGALNHSEEKNPKVDELMNSSRERWSKAKKFAVAAGVFMGLSVSYALSGGENVVPIIAMAAIHGPLALRGGALTGLALRDKDMAKELLKTVKNREPGPEVKVI